MHHLSSNFQCEVCKTLTFLPFFTSSCANGISSSDSSDSLTMLVLEFCSLDSKCDYCHKSLDPELKSWKLSVRLLEYDACWCVSSVFSKKFTGSNVGVSWRLLSTTGWDWDISRRCLSFLGLIGCNSDVTGSGPNAQNIGEFTWHVINGFDKITDRYIILFVILLIAIYKKEFDNL